MWDMAECLNTGDHSPRTDICSSSMIIVFSFCGQASEVPSLAAISHNLQVLLKFQISPAPLSWSRLCFLSPLTSSHLSEHLNI